MTMQVKEDGRVKLTPIREEALRSVSAPNAVLWPRSDSPSVKQYASTPDGRQHFQAPVDDAFALFQAGLIDSHGVITDAGRLALSASKVQR